MKIKRPKNLRLIYSSPLLNKQANLNSKSLRHFQQVFTVYTVQYVIDNNIDINCGNKKCDNCRSCYGDFTTVTPYINEVLKK